MMRPLFFLLINLMIITNILSQSNYLSLINKNRFDLKYFGRTNILQGDFNKDGVLNFAYSTEDETNSFIRIISREGDKYKTVSFSK